MSSFGHVFVVKDQADAVLAVFTEEAGAEAYTAARDGRTLTVAPLVRGEVGMTTVHTRWIEIDATGEVQAHAHDTYGWCPELDDQEEAPPVAEVEHYVEGTSQRLLGVGTDLDRLDEQLRQSVQPGPAGKNPTPA